MKTKKKPIRNPYAISARARTSAGRMKNKRDKRLSNKKYFLTEE